MTSLYTVYYIYLKLAATLYSKYKLASKPVLGKGQPPAALPGAYTLTEGVYLSLTTTPAKLRAEDLSHLTKQEAVALRWLDRVVCFLSSRELRYYQNID